MVHALDRFAASNRNVRNNGVEALRSMTAGQAANAAKLEAAGGTHYLDIELGDNEDSEEDEDSAEEDEESEDSAEEEEDDGA